MELAAVDYVTIHQTAIPVMPVVPLAKTLYMPARIIAGMRILAVPTLID
jgi:hypothetical protein